MPLPNPDMNFTAFDILTAAEMNQLVENIESLADGTGLADGAVTAGKTTGIWWGELGRASNTGQTSISVSGFTPKKFLMIIATFNPSTSMDVNMRFNNDSGNNYSWRGQLNDTAETTATSTNLIKVAESTTNIDFMLTANIINVASSGKQILMTTGSGASGVTNAPSRRSYNGKWGNTSVQISRVDILASTGNLGAAELIILGHD